jgi:HpcH/HpaI aldolase/citrate lyase family
MLVRRAAARVPPEATLLTMSGVGFELFLFTADPSVAADAVRGGVDGVIVDWESRGKKRRQATADTEINADTPDDLRRIRAATDAHVIWRINACGAGTEEEVELALECGAAELLLPMVRQPSEVEVVLQAANGRCPVGILVETVDAVENAHRLATLPLSRVYLGLNDLAIDRRTPSIFAPLVDGTLDRVRSAFSVPFGFAGLTRPAGGRPVPCRLLVAEMARVGSSFGILRRAYRRDVPSSNGHALAVAEIREAIAAARARDAGAIKRDRADLTATISRVEQRPWVSAIGAP